MCQWKWRMDPGKEVVRGTWNIKSGKTCYTRHVAHLGNLGFVFHKMEVLKQPANGKITVVRPFGIRFTPNPGFHGRDYADIRITLRSAGDNYLYPTVIQTKIKVRK